MRTLHQELVIFQQSRNCFRYVTDNETEGGILGWTMSPESKIQLVGYELSPKYILGLSTLEEIRSIDAYIFCKSFRFVLLSNYLSIFIYLYAQFFDFP